LHIACLRYCEIDRLWHVSGHCISSCKISLKKYSISPVNHAALWLPCNIANISAYATNLRTIRISLLIDNGTQTEKNGYIDTCPACKYRHPLAHPKKSAKLNHFPVTAKYEIRNGITKTGNTPPRHLQSERKRAQIELCHPRRKSPSPLHSVPFGPRLSVSSWGENAIIYKQKKANLSHAHCKIDPNKD